MDVYYPSQSAVENSHNGMQLLANLMIPSLTVTDALRIIVSTAGTIDLKIVILR